MLAAQGETGRCTKAAPDLAGWIGLAAAPTFAVMALVTGLQARNMPDMVCSATQGAPLTGMVSMYLLMSGFHAASWLKLLSRRSSRDANAC